MYNITYPKFPSLIPKICVKNVSDKNNAVQCNLCELWVHSKRNNVNYLDYRYLQNSNESWYCIECCSIMFLFNSLSSNKNFLTCCTNTDNNSTHWIDLENDHNSSLSLKRSSNQELLVNQFNNAIPENSNDPEKVCSSKYYDIEEIHNIEIPHKNKSLSLFHIDACSLNKNFDDLQHLLNCTQKKKKFDIIAISETRITKQVSLLNNLNLNIILLNLLQLRLLQMVPFFTLLIIYHINAIMT